MSLSVEPLFWTVALAFFTAIVLKIFTVKRLDFTKLISPWSEDGLIEGMLRGFVNFVFNDAIGNDKNAVEMFSHTFRFLVWLFMLALFVLGCVFFGAIEQSSTIAVAVPAGCDIQADGSGDLPMKGYNIMAFVNLLFFFTMFSAFLLGSVVDEKLRKDTSSRLANKSLQSLSGILIAGSMISLLLIDTLWISGAALYSPYGDITSYNATAISAFAFALLCLIGNFTLFHGASDSQKLMTFNKDGNVVFGIHELVLIQFITIDMYSKVLLFSDQVRVFTYVLTCLILPMLMKPYGNHTYMFKYTVCNVVFWCAFYMFYVIFPGNVDAASDGFNPTQSSWLYYLGIWCNPSSFSLAETSSLLYTIAVLTLVNTLFIFIYAFKNSPAIIDSWKQSIGDLQVETTRTISSVSTRVSTIGQ
jgi:hypothetical protein